MERYRHLLAATDFSGASHRAVDAASNLATHLDARVSLLHVYDSALGAPALFPDSAADVEDAIEKDAVEKLETLRSQRMASPSKTEIAAVAHVGAARAIVDYAGAHDVDLCVLGTHGRTGLVHMLLGSVAEKVVRHATCDVLVVGRASKPNAPFAHSILVATDLSEPSVAALKRAHHLAKLFDAKLTALYVFDDEGVPPPVDGAGRRPRDEIHRAQLAELDKLRVAYLGGADRAAAEMIESASTAATICDYAENHGHDLIVVATHGRTGLERMLIGSVAERVARHATRPVLVVRVRPDEA